MLADAEGAKQAIRFHQLVTQNRGQFAARQTAHQFHLEQPILRMHKAECAVHVGFVLGLNMRHTALVISNADGGLQVRKIDAAVAGWLFAGDVPRAASGGHANDDGKCSQSALHRKSFLLLGDWFLAAWQYTMTENNRSIG